MTDTLISLLSIFFGLIGANVLSKVKKKYTLGFAGNTIAGIFGSILFIKLFGRLGFDPRSIMGSGEMNGFLFIVNMMVSIVGGLSGLIGIKLLKNKMTALS